ncbi:MAG: acyltransferase [Acidimicrobiales bacterium]
MQHLPTLDGVRGAAVIGVVLFHAGYLRGGFLGVDVFFVLSGFLITRILLDEEQRTGSIDLREFYRRRLRRLAPALVVCCGGRRREPVRV